MSFSEVQSVFGCILNTNICVFHSCFLFSKSLLSWVFITHVFQWPSPTLWNPLDCSTSGLPVPHHLLESAKFILIASVMRPAISSSDTLFSLCPRSSPASGTFLMSRLFASDSISPSSEHWGLISLKIDWFDSLKISLLSKGLSGVFSSTTIGRHNFFGVLPSLRSSSHKCTWPLGRPGVLLHITYTSYM